MILTQEKALALAEKYGTPLYVYDEGILRARCRELAELLPDRHFKVNYSAKANTNLEILKIVREEGAFGGCDCRRAKSTLNNWQGMSLMKSSISAIMSRWKRCAMQWSAAFWSAWDSLSQLGSVWAEFFPGGGWRFDLIRASALGTMKRWLPAERRPSLRCKKIMCLRRKRCSKSTI